jgi:hypothetical protein
MATLLERVDNAIERADTTREFVIMHEQKLDVLLTDIRVIQGNRWTGKDAAYQSVQDRAWVAGELTKIRREDERLQVQIDRIEDTMHGRALRHQGEYVPGTGEGME